jgi:putative endonuclease
MAFYCYILECSDGSYYTGWSMDPHRRLTQHNHGTGARYTRSRRPVRLVYMEELPDKRAALKRERAIKALTRPKKQILIVSFQFFGEAGGCAGSEAASTSNQ